MAQGLDRAAAHGLIRRDQRLLPAPGLDDADAVIGQHIADAVQLGSGERRCAAKKVGDDARKAHARDAGGELIVDFSGVPGDRAAGNAQAHE